MIASCLVTCFESHFFFLVPDTFPSNLTGFNTSSTELFLEWSHLKDKEWNGRALGYKIFFILKRGYKTQEVKISPHATRTTLDNLLKFTWYKIQIAAFTSKGTGPRSPEIELRTSEDGRCREIKIYKISTYYQILILWFGY